MSVFIENSRQVFESITTLSTFSIKIFINEKQVIILIDLGEAYVESSRLQFKIVSWNFNKIVFKLQKNLYSYLKRICLI